MGKPQYQEIRTKLKLESAELPVSQARDELLRYISQEPTVIVVGETGSGKTTRKL